MRPLFNCTQVPATLMQTVAGHLLSFVRTERNLGCPGWFSPLSAATDAPLELSPFGVELELLLLQLLPSVVIVDRGLNRYVERPGRR